MKATQAGGRFVRRLAGRLMKAPDDGSTAWETVGLAESQLSNGQVDAVVDRRELTARIGRVLRILDRPLLETGPPLAVVWAQEGADRAARAAQALPGISRRWLQRVLSDEDGGLVRRLLARLRGEIRSR